MIIMSLLSSPSALVGLWVNGSTRPRAPAPAPHLIVDCSFDSNLRKSEEK
jgi:hypothetical protein